MLIGVGVVCHRFPGIALAPALDPDLLVRAVVFVRGGLALEREIRRARMRPGGMGVVAQVDHGALGRADQRRGRVADGELDLRRRMIAAEVLGDVVGAPFLRTGGRDQ